MPKYGESQYGLFQYGIYELDGGGSFFSVKTPPRMRMRMRSSSGGIGLWLETQLVKAPIPAKYPLTRIRTNTGEWVHTQSVVLPHLSNKIRIRAVKENEVHPWVLYEQAIIKGE